MIVDRRAQHHDGMLPRRYHRRALEGRRDNLSQANKLSRTTEKPRIGISGQPFQSLPSTARRKRRRRVKAGVAPEFTRRARDGKGPRRARRRCRR